MKRDNKKPQWQAEERQKTITVKTRQTQLNAIAKYDSKFHPTMCRVPLDLYDKITATGESANSVIIKALEQYFSQIERDKAEKSQD